MYWPVVCFIAAGFVSGSVLYSMVLPRWIKGVDVVALSDDHNPGTANAFIKAGIPCGREAGGNPVPDLRPGEGVFPGVDRGAVPAGGVAALCLCAGCAGDGPRLFPHAAGAGREVHCRHLRGAAGDSAHLEPAGDFSVVIHLLFGGGHCPAPPAPDHLGICAVCGGVRIFLPDGVHCGRVRSDFGRSALPASFAGAGRSAGMYDFRA